MKGISPKVDLLLYGITILLTASAGEGINCYTCPATTVPFLCLPMECNVGESCFTQAWLQHGVTYYQRGCLTPSIVGDCETLSNYFCSNTNVFHCCTGENCNRIDPLMNWSPKTPRNVIPSVRETSVELTWDPICIGDYRYDVEYAKLVGGTTAGHVHLTTSTYSNSIYIHSLQPGTSYLFRVKSYHSGIHSQARTIDATTLPAAIGAPVLDVKANCWHTDQYFGAPNYIRTCSNKNDFCFSRGEYFANTSERLTSRGCMSEVECQTHIASNVEQCNPGRIGAICHFCCRGENCNTVEWTYSGLSCENIPTEERILCGWSGIPIAECLHRGCCYLPSNETVAWCHHGKYHVNTTPGPPIAEAQVLSIWMIVLIVLVLIILIVIIIIIVRCCLKRKRKQQSGSYDIYAIPKSRHERRSNIATVSRESYDNMVISD